MAPKVYPNPTMDTRPPSTDIPSRAPSATETAKQTLNKIGDTKVIDAAMKGIMPKEMAGLINAYLEAANKALGSMGVFGRDAYSEGKFPQAFIEDPKKLFDNHFLSQDTSKIPEYRMIGSLLSNLKEAVNRGYFTPQQAEALNVFLNMQDRLMMQTAKGQGASQGGAQSQGEQSHKDEYEEFYKNMIEGEEGGSGSAGTPQAYYYSDPNAGQPQGTSGATPGVSNQGGRLSITGPGGTSGAPGPGPTGPGGFPPPPPPPPPPSGGPGGPGGQTPYDQYQDRLPGMMSMENDYLNSNFSQGDPFYGWFQSLFGSENWYRDFSARALTELQAIKGAKEGILAALSRVDASTPQGAKKLYMLQQKLGDIQQSERQIYDHISSAQKANNERKEMIKAIFEMYFQTSGAISRNIGK